MYTQFKQIGGNDMEWYEVVYWYDTGDGEYDNKTDIFAESAEDAERIFDITNYGGTKITWRRAYIK